MAPMGNKEGLPPPPPPPPLSGSVVNSYAFLTIKDRLPVILTKVIDDLCRDRKRVVDELGDEAAEDIAAIAGEISKLKYQMQTDKPLSLLDDSGADCYLWNQALADNDANSPSGVSLWFSSPWLFVECYMYRRVRAAFLGAPHLKTLDPFRRGKRRALVSAKPSMISLLRTLQNMLSSVLSSSSSSSSSHSLKQMTRDLFLLCLWGNKSDLSISAGDANDRGHVDSLDALRRWDKDILVDDFDAIWEVLSPDSSWGSLEGGRNGIVIDWVLDNAGFEFITDLMLAEFLTQTGLASKIRFHVKSFPWFVSDVTSNDVRVTLDWMSTSTDNAVEDNDADKSDNEMYKLVTQREKDLSPELMSHFSGIWAQHFASSTWSIEEHPFWTLPNAFRGIGEEGGGEGEAERARFPCKGMVSAAPDLYATLASSDLALFKGDLNYRKLMGDLDWETTTSFDDALGDFRPTRVAALRTLKANVVTGLPDGMAGKLDAESKDWMTNGRYAVIQLS